MIEPIRWLGRSAVQDTILVATLVALNVFVALWSGFPREEDPRFGPWAGLGLQVVVVVVLAVRRVWPLVVLGA
ncbi:hypothetical protein ADL01_39900, partial [Streptomyces sp. NRRL WC-3618]|uniref:hypothetical protein n=1 Tax=Streptomyces sp. NRRL WC-3618 TaxID=1519490 RepID=UPI0006C106B2